MMIMVTASCCVELKVDRTLRHALLIIIYIFIRSKKQQARIQINYSQGGQNTDIVEVWMNLYGSLQSPEGPVLSSDLMWSDVVIIIGLPMISL